METRLYICKPQLVRLCSNFGFVIIVIIAHAQYTLVHIFVIYDNSTIFFAVCAVGYFFLTFI